jgi:antitoxin HigA-1
MGKKLMAVHPGEILREEFMAPHNLNANQLALALRVPAPAIYQIVKERRGISTDMALRLARAFGTTPEFWANLQTHFELELARDKEQTRVNEEVRPIAANSTHSRG